MAQGTILAEIVLEGDRTFRRAVESSGDEMDDAARDAATLSGALGLAGSSLDDTRGDAYGLATAMSVLANRADDAGDNISQAGRRAATTGGLFSALTVSTNGLSFSMGALGATIVGTLVPALALLSTTLAPLAATIAGVATAATALAGAFSLVIGSGALAYGQQLNSQYQEQLLQVRDQIEALEDLREAQGELSDADRRRLRQLKEKEKELDNVNGAASALALRLGQVADEVGAIVAEWGTGFAPLIRDAINSIPTLTRWILDAVGSADRFADALRSFGTQAMFVIPQVAGMMADLAREALPLLVDGMRWFRENGDSIFQGMMQTTREIAPLLLDVGQAFVDALPAINRFGSALLKVLLPALSDGIEGFGNLLEQILAFTKTEQFEEIMAALRDSAEELGPELTALRKNLGKVFRTLVENGPALIEGFTAFADTVLDVVNAVTPVLVAFIDLVGGAMKAWNDWVNRSEQQEQNLADQGLFDYVASGTMDALLPQQSDPRQRVPGADAMGAAQTARGGSQDEIFVRVGADDDRFNAWLDRRTDDKFRQKGDRADRLSGGDS